MFDNVITAITLAAMNEVSPKDTFTAFTDTLSTGCFPHIRVVHATFGEKIAQGSKVIFPNATDVANVSDDADTIDMLPEVTETYTPARANRIRARRREART